MKDYKYLFSEFLEGHKGYHHFRAHSHHFWPNVTKEAILEYYEDSRKLSDDKWEKIFGEKIPLAQRHLARLLNITNPSHIAFAPNTQELFYRLISAFQKTNKKIKILTTDSEFLSFARQSRRLAEDDWIELKEIPTEPFDTFCSRFIEAGKKFNPDIVFVSQVFFNSGFALSNENINQIAEIFCSASAVVIDGYHGFMALPTDLSIIENKIYYLAGSYKYVGAGEGLCFMTLPRDCKLRPLNTGWFADLENLDAAVKQVVYPDNGLRFSGSTMDFSTLYKMIAVFELYEKEGITVNLIHNHVSELQKYFLTECFKINDKEFNFDSLLAKDEEHRGHFLAFKLKSDSRAKEVSNILKRHKILTDVRGNRLRFGFAIYQSPYLPSFLGKLLI